MFSVIIEARKQNRRGEKKSLTKEEKKKIYFQLCGRPYEAFIEKKKILFNHKPVRNCVELAASRRVLCCEGRNGLRVII